MTLIKQQQSGFALYMTLLVVGVVIAVTMSLVELSMKQLELSVGGRDAESAFQAASAATECLRRTTRVESSTVLSGGNSLSFSCFETTRSISKVNDLTGAYHYKGEIDWGTGSQQRCAQFNLIVVNAEGGDVTIGNNGQTHPQNLKNIIASYPSKVMTCKAGSVCYIAATAGYDGVCGASTFKREMLLEF